MTKRLTIFKAVVRWIDGSYSIYTMQAIDRKAVEKELFEELHNVRDSIARVYFDRVGDGQKLA